MKPDKVTLNSFNCRGLRNKKKRLNIFHWLKTNHSGITALQETHTTSNDEQIWEKEWGGKIFFSHGWSNSSGVAILIPNKLLPDFKINNIETDRDGRLLILDCSISDNPFIIICVYFPTKDKVQQQLDYLKNFKKMINKYTGQNLLVGGDFNTCLNVKYDKKGGRAVENESSYTKALKAYMEEVDLIDIWRLRHPEVRQFSRREQSRAGFVQSRIDFWLISVALEYQIGLSTLKPGNNSDHSIISITLELSNTQKRGKGFWKFNNELLKDQTYIAMIKTIIKDIKENVTMENKCQLWIL